MLQVDVIRRMALSLKSVTVEQVAWHFAGEIGRIKKSNSYAGIKAPRAPSNLMVHLVWRAKR